MAESSYTRHNLGSLAKAQEIRNLFESADFTTAYRVEKVKQIIEAERDGINKDVPFAIFGFAQSCGLNDQEAIDFGLQLYQEDQVDLSLFLRTAIETPDINHEECFDIFLSAIKVLSGSHFEAVKETLLPKINDTQKEVLKELTPQQPLPSPIPGQAQASQVDQMANYLS